MVVGQLRIVNILQELSQPFDAKDIILCVSHADPIRLAVAFFVGLPLDMFQRLVVSPASISTLNISEAGQQPVEFECRPFFFLAWEVILVYSFNPNFQQMERL